jgi:predicted ATPase/tRNA A-37 threonylcarbamoyl transferase component Bud32
MIGKTILHYKIIEKLGEGGMGVVYKAEDTKLKREVAIKFLPKQLAASQEDRERFKTEAQAAAALNHVNIATIHAIEEHDDDIFIVMEYVEGQELKDIVEEYRNTPPAMDEIIKYATQIAEGLKAAHKKGIVHRDIKSSNIMINNEGQVKIMDFGLAKMRSGAQLTKQYSVLGTAAYMSPEQVERQQVDERSDIFSFGVVLYEMLSGTLPFSGDYDIAVLYSIVHSDPAPLEEFNPSIPDQLKQVVNQCLKKSRNERYQTCEQLLADLQKLQSSAPETGPNIHLAPEIPIPAVGERNIFIGREAQLKELYQQLQKTMQYIGFTVLIKGESGIGKSTLASQLIKEAQALGMNIFRGQCLFQEGGLPYHPYAQAIKSSFHNSVQDIIELLNGKAEDLGINLTERLPSVHTFLNLSKESSLLLNKEQLWDAIVTLFRVIASDRPTLLLIDDLQWADKTTLGLFSFISRNIPDMPLLQLGIYRPGEYPAERDLDPPTLTDSIRQLKIEGYAIQIDLDRFNEDETKTFVCQLLEPDEVDPQIAQKVFEKTQGNPLFIFELVNFMKSHGIIRHDGKKNYLHEPPYSLDTSEKVQDVIIQRLNRLGDQQKEILEIASCDGEYFRSDAINACLNIDRIPLLKQLQSLEREHRLIHHDKNLYHFDHPLIRHVLYENILNELREEYHRMIAKWLVGEQETQTEAASRISYHLIASGQEKEALTYLLQAAEQARQLFANDEAMKHYHKAQEILSQYNLKDTNVRMSVENGLGEIYSSLGKTNEAISHFTQLLELAQKMKNRLWEIRALYRTADNHRVAGDIKKGIATCKQALALATEPEDTNEKINCMNTLAFIHSAHGEYEKTIQLSKEAIDLSQKINDEKNLSVSLSNLGLAYWHQGEHPLAVENLEKALALQRSIGDSRGIATTLNFVGLAYWRLGQYEQSLSCHEESLKIKKRIGDYPTIPGSINNIGDVYRDIGDLEKAIEHHKQSLELAGEQRNMGAQCDNLRDLGEEHMLMGDYKSSQAYLNEVLEISKTHGYLWYETRSYISLAELYLNMKDIEKADSFSKLGVKSAKQVNAKELILESLWIRAKVLCGLDSEEKGIKLFQQSLKIAEEVGYRFIWLLYWDIGILYGNLRETKKKQQSHQKSKKLVAEILNNFQDQILKETFRNSKKVKEVLDSQ